MDRHSVSPRLELRDAGPWSWKLVRVNDGVWTEGGGYSPEGLRAGLLCLHHLAAGLPESLSIAMC